MSIEVENKLDQIIQLLEELLQEVKKPSIPTQGEDDEWHNPENVSIEQLGKGYRFLKPWEIERRNIKSCQLFIDELDGTIKWVLAQNFPCESWTYRVPADTPIPPKP